MGTKRAPAREIDGQAGGKTDKAPAEAWRGIVVLPTGPHPSRFGVRGWAGTMDAVCTAENSHSDMLCDLGCYIILPLAHLTGAMERKSRPTLRVVVPHATTGNRQTTPCI